VNDQQGYSDQQGYELFPHRRPATRPPSLRPGGRHRRDVPVGLPHDAPALVLAVPGPETDLTVGSVGDLLTILRVDNPSVDVRGALIDVPADDPSSVPAVLAAVSAVREESGGPAAVVIPLIVAPHPPLVRKLRAAIADSGVNAIVSGFINSNGLVAEALHIRLAEAGLARADRVRLFSIVTAADGIIVATAGGPDAAQATNVTAVMLAARLALPVFTASMDSSPSVADVTMRLREMGVSRLAIAPCIIGPEAKRTDLDAMTVEAECAAPLGAHGNIAKLAALAYGQAISQMEIPGDEL
jgi:hypothetical protein